MTKSDKSNSLQTLDKSILGQKVCYTDHYDPRLLFPVLRQEKRDELGIIAGALPFFGHDYWTAFEVSWLNMKGKPQVALVDFIFSAHSPYLIESKSFKLYLNSFNQTRFSSIEDVQKTMQKDLAQSSGGDVEVIFRSVYSAADIIDLKTLSSTLICLDELDISCDGPVDYQLRPSLLQGSANGTKAFISETVYSHLLKSNCLVTGQPDWGSVFISYEGPHINHEDLLRYIISFRQHNEFHEQCVERIFSDIMKYCAPSRLSVYARYTRRGGLDINPFRSNLREEKPLFQGRLLRQ